MPLLLLPKLPRLLYLDNQPLRNVEHQLDHRNKDGISLNHQLSSRTETVIHRATKVVQWMKVHL